MSTTVNLHLPEWDPAQAQPNVKANLVTRILDTYCTQVVVNYADSLPTTPANGSMWIVRDGVDDFLGHDDELAIWYDGLYFVPATNGLRVWVDELGRYDEFTFNLWGEAGEGAVGIGDLMDWKDDVDINNELTDDLATFAMPGNINLEEGLRRFRLQARGLVENNAGGARQIAFNLRFVDLDAGPDEIVLLQTPATPNLPAGTPVVWELEMTLLVQPSGTDPQVRADWIGTMRLYDEAAAWGGTAAIFASKAFYGRDVQIPWVQDAPNTAIVLGFENTGSDVLVAIITGQLERLA